MSTASQPWLGRYDVLSDDHHPELDARAAVHEFKGRLPRAQAEAQAHRDYLKERAYDAASHHLLGVRAAHAAGHMEAARAHGAQYAAALTSAGDDPAAAPPRAVLDRAQDLKLKVYAFKAHPADRFFPVEVKEDQPAPAPAQQAVNRLKGLVKALLG